MLVRIYNCRAFRSGNLLPIATTIPMAVVWPTALSAVLLKMRSYSALVLALALDLAASRQLTKVIRPAPCLNRCDCWLLVPGQRLLAPLSCQLLAACS